MKKPFEFLVLASLVASGSACGGEDEPQVSPTPASTYTITKVYDVANNGGASDIRVELGPPAAADLAQITEARLVIAKASKPLTAEQIGALSDESSLSIPISSDVKQVIKPGANVKDADSDVIVNGVAYKIYIATLGKQGSKQLSDPKDLTLEDKPVYAGDYRGTWEDLGPPGPGKFPMSLRVDEAYAGRVFYTGNFIPYGKGAQDATGTLVVNGGAFSFAMDQLIGQYVGGGHFSPGSGGGCPAAKTLTGAIEGDVTLVFDVFNWSDCDGKRDVKLTFTRQ